MKLCCIAVLILALLGCSKPYRDLETAFAKDKESTGTLIKSKSISITSRKYRGISSYEDIVEIRASNSSIDFKVNMPFTRTISVPIGEIAGCSMTCFGTDDPYVDLLIPKTGTDISIKGRQQMVDWCWKSALPMMSSNSRRGWQYSGVALPSRDSFKKQLSSKELYDHQASQSCMGY